MPSADKSRSAAALLAFLTAYLFVLGGLIYNYQPGEGPLSSFFPEQGEVTAESIPLHLTCGDLDGDGSDEAIVSWEGGLIEVYSPSSGLSVNVTMGSTVTGLFATSTGSLFALSVDGRAATYGLRDGILVRYAEFHIVPGITDCALMYDGGDTVRFAYTVPGKSMAGIALLSVSGLENEAVFKTPYAAYAVDYIADLNGTEYLAFVNLAEVSGMLLYPLRSGSAAEDYVYVDTGTRVTTALSGRFFANGTEMAVINYDMDSVSLYGPGVSAPFMSPVLTISTGAAPYSAIAVDLNGDGLEEICVLDFKSHTVTAVYPSYNTTITYPVGRSPSDISVWRSGDSVAVCILNRYSKDLSFLALMGGGTPPVILGPSIRIGDLYHTVGGGYVIYARQSASEVCLTSLLEPFTPQLVLYRGGGQLTYRVLADDGDTLSIAISDSSTPQIRLVALSINGTTPQILALSNVSAQLNVKSFDVGDVDGDGDMDMVFIAYSVPRCTMGIIYNPGDIGKAWYNSTFASMVEYPVSLALTDINGDGYPDADVVDRRGNHYIYYNTGGAYESDTATPLTGG